MFHNIPIVHVLQSQQHSGVLSRLLSSRFELRSIQCYRVFANHTVDVHLPGSESNGTGNGMRMVPHPEQTDQMWWVKVVRCEWQGMTNTVFSDIRLENRRVWWAMEMNVCWSINCYSYPAFIWVDDDYNLICLTNCNIISYLSHTRRISLRRSNCQFHICMWRRSMHKFEDCNRALKRVADLLTENSTVDWRKMVVSEACKFASILTCTVSKLSGCLLAACSIRQMCMADDFMLYSWGNGEMI